MHFFVVTYALIAIAASTLELAAQQHDPKRVRYGEHLARECSTCHRRDGVDNGIPSILGMKTDEFTETMNYYKAGSRPNHAMISVAQSLDDDQIAALAAFYATLTPPPKKPAAAKP